MREKNKNFRDAIRGNRDARRGLGLKYVFGKIPSINLANFWFGGEAKKQNVEIERTAEKSRKQNNKGKRI